MHTNGNRLFTIFAFIHNFSNLMEISQEELEQRLMDLLLQGDNIVVTILRQQYASAKVTDRKFTGVGFYTDFEVSENAPLLVEHPNLDLLGVDIQLENLNHGAGCILVVRDGKLSYLECYTHTDPWPDQIIIKSLAIVPVLTGVITPEIAQELKKLNKKASKEKPSVHVGAVVIVGELIILFLVAGFYLFSGFLTILGIIALIIVYIQRGKFDAKQAKIDEELKLIREKIAEAQKIVEAESTILIVGQ